MAARKPVVPDSYIYKVLKQIHPDAGITKKGMQVMTDYVSDMFDRLCLETKDLCEHTKSRTAASRDVQTATRLLLNGGLAKHAVSDGTKAVTKFRQEKDKDSRTKQATSASKKTSAGTAKARTPTPPRTPRTRAQIDASLQRQRKRLAALHSDLRAQDAAGTLTERQTAKFTKEFKTIERIIEEDLEERERAAPRQETLSSRDAAAALADLALSPSSGGQAVATDMGEARRPGPLRAVAAPVAQPLPPKNKKSAKARAAKQKAAAAKRAARQKAASTKNQAGVGEKDDEIFLAGGTA